MRSLPRIVIGGGTIALVLLMVIASGPATADRWGWSYGYGEGIGTYRVPDWPDRGDDRGYYGYPEYSYDRGTYAPRQYRYVVPPSQIYYFPGTRYYQYNVPKNLDQGNRSYSPYSPGDDRSSRRGRRGTRSNRRNRRGSGRVFHTG